MPANLENSAVAPGLGKNQFSIPIPRKAMPKNVQTTTPLHSFHTLSEVMLKILQARLQWYMNHELSGLQSSIFKLDLEKAQEPENRLPTSAGSSKKQESSRKTSTSALVTMPKSLCGSQQQWKILQEMGLPDHLTCLLRNLHAGQEARHGTTDWL